MQAIILASSSAYRADLLRRLGRPVECVSPAIDESPLVGESAVEVASRLARHKAEKIAQDRESGIILGSDQVPVCEDDPSEVSLGKPGHQRAARLQLQYLSGRCVQFYTAICLLDVDTGRCFEACDHTMVRMRPLDDAQIDRYLSLEPAFNCAGSFKAEGLGISLFESIDSTDPTGLIGLPLILVCRGLRELGLSIP